MGISFNTDLSQINPSYNSPYTAGINSESKQQDAQVKETASKAEETGSVGAVYEKSAGKEKTSGLYSIAQMKKADRSAIIQQMKADQEKRINQMSSLVTQMMSGQTRAVGLSKQEGDIWEILSQKELNVSPATIRQAQEDVQEDGYWGVKQTSERMFDFAQALAGDDPDKMKTMQEAMQKGYEQAEKTWGGSLPELSKQTLEAANQLFEDYYASLETEI